VRTGQKPLETKDLAMELFVLLFVIALGLAARFGFVVDSRDSADWAATDDGSRVSRR
jgi:hypothetical protein